MTLENNETKFFSWSEPLAWYDEKYYGNDWKNVAKHVRQVLMSDLVNPADYGEIDIDAESGRLHIYVRGVKPELWDYFENERCCGEGEED